MEWLKNILGNAYTEEVEQKIAEEIGRVYVSKVDFEAKETEATALKEQLKEASKTINGFKDLDVEGMKQEVENWKQKAQQAEKDAAAQVAAVKFDARLDTAITKAGGRNAKAIRALLDLENLQKSQQQDEDIAAALEGLAKDNDYLFQAATPPPYAAGTGSTPPAGNPDAALRAAFGLPAAENK